ncbi:helix-turn-helix domain containing protein [Tsukamurella sp. 8F]|uniref:TetR/AcrR family transcriptional regulator n=1 Tax=unclassified Tsukamurella TaxID=2633480 RepID=UPI0023B92F61|nr:MULTISPECIES: TetR/AcrR family transcriptional regulator [unclassified Tsukamurella]MDF0529160.1 helix-turn-helix domain containing protein [Tsukamurella sp. 8J]MDF0585345.1 helix-turn-helix domain containing protein [Tsukamurella sp. 8F]
MSQDLNGGRVPANAIPEDVILDAARDLLATVGIRRTTMADVARAAVVSRATLYRRFSNIEELAAAVTTREFQNALGEVAAADTGDLDGLVTIVVHAVRVARTHPLMRRIVQLDPDWLATYLLQRPGRTSTMQLGVVEDRLARAVDAGVCRDDDPHELAVGVLLTAWSFALTGPVFAPDDSTLLDHQLTELLTRYLRP